MSELTPDYDTISDRLAAAADGGGGIEAQRMLGALSERLFGVSGDPVELGRFLILRRLGAGGMGVVYLGYDRELDRNVALKLIRSRATGAEASATAEARLLREARALARVDHPNVIAIHEVGTDDGAVFLAMERVDGCTLSAWQRERPRRWRELVGVYLQAGRGLAAAHAAGVVHRDFKPDNVLVSDDGEGLGIRARVVDFGLARALAAEDAGEVTDVAEAIAELSEDSMTGGGVLTRTGARLGTPAYMAPEQIAGRAADARSDQFSFGLALYEALMGERAFAGDDVEALLTAVVDGRRRPAPRGRRIPGAIRRALDRALEIDPERRFPSMVALLAAIDGGLRSRRRRGVALAGVGVAIAAGLVGGAAARPGICSGGQAAIAEVWGGERRAAAEAAFLGTGKPYATKAWEEAARRLDAYALAWATMHDDACAATQLRGEQSSEALDLRMACLDRRRDELAALVELFADGDAAAKVVPRAVEATEALTPLSGCADLEVLATPEPLPEDPRIRAEVDALRQGLARGKAERDAGRYEEGLALAEELDAAAQELDYGPLRAEAALLVGTLRGFTGDAEQAGIDFDRAFTAALASGHTEVAMWSAIHAVHVVGFIGHHGYEGRRWAHLAEPLVTRLGAPPRAQTALESNIGNIAVLQGELEEAKARFSAAIERGAQTLGEGDVLIAKTSANLGAVYRRLGDHERGLAAYRRAASIFEASFGASHPIMATLANNMGALYHDMGAVDEAEASYRSVLALAGTSMTESSPTLGHAHNNLGEILIERRQFAEAAEHYGAAVEVWERSHGPEHPLLAHPLIGLGGALLELDQPEEAAVALRRALDLRLGAEFDEATIAEVREDLARAEAASGADGSPPA